MKKFYSLILLVSFLVGTLQPILPAIDFELNRGNIIELLNSKDCDAGIFEEVHNSDCTSGEDNGDQSLLDIDYYPLALQISSIPKPIAFPHKSRAYLPLKENVINPAFLPNPPPPRLS